MEMLTQIFSFVDALFYQLWEI